jgi:hypothetical protein
MALCPSCKAEGWAPDVPCPECGRSGAAVTAPRETPSLELDVPQPPPKPVAPRAKVVEEPLKLELAVDLDAMHSSPPPALRSSNPPASGSGQYAKVGGVAPAVPVRIPSNSRMAAVKPNAYAPPPAATAPVDEDEAEVAALGAFGDPPKTWVLSPLYAYRVYQRQRELRKALAERREEAAQAKTTLEDALVATASRVRPRASKTDAYKAQLSDVAVAEELLRSRDGALAKEQDAHAARLADIDARITKLEQELAAAQADERKVATEVAAVEASLGRADAKLKRAEAEIRAHAAPRGTG